VNSCATSQERWEDAVRVAPDVPELWYNVADHLVHCGAAMGVEDWMQRSLAGFDRARALDSSFTPALEHLPAIYAMLRDTAAAHRALGLFPDTSDFLPFNQYFALPDSASRAAAMRTLVLGPLPALTAGARFMMSHAEPANLDDADRLLRTAQARAVTDADRRAVAQATHFVALSAGQPARALAAATAAGLRPADLVIDRIFWDGDSSAAARAMPAVLSTVARQPSAAAEDEWVTTAMAAAEYDFASRGPTDVGARLVGQLRSFKGSLFETSRAQRFALLLDAQRAVATKAPNAATLVASADSMLRRVEQGEYNEPAGNLIVARLWEQVGDFRRAHAATLRVELRPVARPFQSTFWRERGRLAAAAGDTSDAIRAYRQYVSLRAHADAALKPDLDNAKRELARLERQPAGK
jgi:hypothetical protein